MDKARDLFLAKGQSPANHKPVKSLFISAVMRLIIHLAFLVSFGTFLASGNTRIKVDQGLFVEVGSPLSGFCPNVKFYLTESDCAGSTQEPVPDSGFTTSQNASGTTFELSLTTFRTYTLVCGERCIPVVSYELTLDKTKDDIGTIALACNMRFTRSESDQSFAFPDSISWLKNGVLLDTETLTQPSFDNTASNFSSIERLRVLNAQESAEGHSSPAESKSIGGVYTCQFTVGAETLSKEYVLNETLVAKILVEPDDKRQYQDGDDVTLICRVTGYPVENITWLFNGAPLDGVNTMLETTAEYRSLSFNLTNLEDKVNRGEYTCVASNGVTDFMATKTLHVRDRLAPLWPFIGICVQVVVLVVFILLGERLRKKEHNEKVRRQREQANNQLTSTPSAVST